MEQTGSGYYVIDVYSLKQASKRPSHLEQRFLRTHPPSNTPEHAERNRNILLEAKRQKLNQKFVDIQKVVSEVKAQKERQRLHMLQSLELAELKRKHHLEQRRTASKEQVDRAKIIASQNIRRCEAEQERQRVALESRLAKSQARRLTMLGLPKSRIFVSGTLRGPSKTAIAAAPAKSKQRASSARKTQKARMVTAAAAYSGNVSTVTAAFRSLELPFTTAPDSWPNFSQLVRILRKPKVIQTTAKALAIALNLNERVIKRRTRIFLSTYMMLMCPAEVFQEPEGTEEQRLIMNAKHTLQSFESWSAAPGRQIGSTTQLAFEECWNGFYALFEAWKRRDKEQLVDNMTHYYLEIVRFRYTLGKQGEIDGVASQLTQQADQAKACIQRLGGPSALKQLDSAEKALGLEEPAGETKSVPPSPTPRHEKAKQTASTSQEHVMSQEQLTRLRSGYASALSNEQLAHEIIIDPDFKLQNLTSQSQPADLHAHVKAIATKAFFDQVKENIDAGNLEKDIPMLMKDIQERLLNMVRPGQYMYERISEGIDVDLIIQQIRSGVFDLDEMLRSCQDAMLEICAPVRDNDIRKVSELHIPARIQRILEILDDMALDLANFRLLALRPHLIPIAVEYESNQFADALDKRTVGLAKTRSWLARAVQQLNDTPPHDTSAQSDLGGPGRPRPNAKTVFEKAVAMLMTSPEPMKREEIPETWLLDADRLARDQNELQAITMVAALVTLAKSFGAKGDMGAFANKLFVMLEDHKTNIDDLASMIDEQVTVAEDRRDMIRKMVNKTLSHTDTVYLLLARRIDSVIRTHLQTGQFVTKAILTSYGLELVQKPLGELCKRLFLLVRHNYNVYAQWYNPIIADELNMTMAK